MRHDERRRGLRTPVDFFVQVRVGEGFTLHPATDISTTGIYLLASDDHGAFDPERPLEIEFTLPTGAAVRTRAHIAYIDDRLGQRGIGLEMNELATFEYQAIERFVEASQAARRRLG